MDPTLSNELGGSFDHVVQSLFPRYLQMIDILKPVTNCNMRLWLRSESLCHFICWLKRENRKRAVTRTLQFSFRYDEFLYKTTRLRSALPAIDITEARGLKAKIYRSQSQYLTYTTNKTTIALRTWASDVEHPLAETVNAFDTSCMSFRPWL